MYHVELRQFPHNFCRFNLTERELHDTILDAWARDEWIDLGERKWSPHQANLTVLDGPRMPVEQLSMGRGWRNASRQGKDVTEQLLLAARANAATASPAATTGAGAPSRAESSESAQPGQGADAGTATPGRPVDGDPQVMSLAADSLALEVLSRLTAGDDQPPIALAWQLGRARYPDRSAGDCLRLAELALLSLSHAKLIVLLAAAGDGEERHPLEVGETLERALLAIDAWGGAGEAASLLMRRA